MNKYIILLACFLLSCNERFKEDYYPSGDIKSKSFYEGNFEVPYKVVNYYQNGLVMDTLHYNDNGNLNGLIYYNNTKNNFEKWTNYLDGVKSGANIIKKSCGDEIYQHYENNKLNCIERSFNSSGRLSYEVLWLNGKAIMANECSYIEKGDTLLGRIDTKDNHSYVAKIVESDIRLDTYYNITTKQKKIIGSMFLDSETGIADYKKSSYFSISKKDTVKRDSLLEVQILGAFNGLSDVKLEMKIGQLNENLEFIGAIKYYESEIDSLDITFNIDDYDTGYNLLLGKARLMRDSVILFETILFDDFYVLH